MSRQANKKVIGFFVVGAIALVVVTVVILGSGKLFKKTFTAVCYFEGSVGGLNVGAPVVFRGVRVGSVSRIVLRFETKKLLFSIPVYIEIEPDQIEEHGESPMKMGENLNALIDRGLRAKLEMQSIVTGQLQVALDLHPDVFPKFAQFKIEKKTPEIPTMPTPLQELVKTIQNLPIDVILQKVSSTLDGVNEIVKSPELKESIRSVKLALADAQKLIKDMNGQVGPMVSNLNETVKDIRGLVRNADTQLTSLTSNLDGAVKDVRGLVQNANSQVSGLTSNLDGTVKDVRGVLNNVDNSIGPLITRIEGTLQALEATLTVAQRTMNNLSGAAGQESDTVYQVNRTFEEFHSLARSIRILTDYLERHPESLIRGKTTIRQGDLK